MLVFTRAWIVRCGLAAMTLSVGCIGLSHQRVEMPRLMVQGMLLNSSGEPWPDYGLIIALADFYGESETFGALGSGHLDANAHDYKFCQISSGAAGEFSCQLPGEHRHVGSMAPFHPSKRTLHSFVVGIRTEPGTVFAITVSGNQATVRVPAGAKLAEPNGDKLPFSVSAIASRSGQADVLQLVLRARKPAV